MNLSIVIVNYNSGEHLPKCLVSLEKNLQGVDHEVVVVDNASTDGGVAKVKAAFPSVNFLENLQNLGFSAANNQGIKKATGEYVLLLNHDTEVKEGAIQNLLEFMEKYPEAGACGPKVLNSDGSIQHQCKRGFPTPLSILFYISGLSKRFPKNPLFGHYLMTHLDPDKVNEIDSLSGACMLIRKSILDKIGGLDTSFFLYGEDIDLCYRIKEAGWKIYYVPQAEIIHYGGVGSRTMSSKGIRAFHESMFIFYDKHYKKKYPFFVTWLVYAGIQLKMRLNLLTNYLRREKFVGSRKP